MPADPVSSLNAALEGRYHIERQLGEGGMATVYLAADLKHERKVALKVLKPELAAVVGAERFLAEIKTTANLQHPHILPLHDSGNADGFLFYVMPYVEGESLRDRLDREHQLPVDEAVRIATDVAEALDYAHAHGVIHRDIKPANILLHAGRPLIADFGIALALSAGGGGRLTETGLSLGTPHYMSPEQATGDLSVGAASDIYALGCVLYEMLVGEPPYTGSTAQAILGKIVTGDADPVSRHRRSVPANVDAAIRRALEKVPADRLSSAQDFAKALGDPAFRHGAMDSEITARVAGGRGNALVGVLSASTVVLALALGWALLRPSPLPPTERQVLSTDGWAGLETPLGAVAALAPDGSSMILPLDDGHLGLKIQGSTDVTPIPDTQGAQDVVYSPDSRSIAYGLNGELLVRPIAGGAAVRVAADAQEGNRLGLAWLEDGTILYEAASPELHIAQIPQAGGEPRVVIPDQSAWWIDGLPKGRGALVVTAGGQLLAVDLEDLGTTVVTEGVYRAWYVDTGHLVYVRTDGAVFTQRFDTDALEVRGDPVPLFDGVRAGAGNRADMRLAADGTLLYVEGPATRLPDIRSQLVLVDLQGNREVLALPPRNIGWAGWAPDGRTVVFVSGGQIYTYDVTLDAPPRQITYDGVNTWPIISPDGSRIVFSSTPDRTLPLSSLYVRDLTSSAPAGLLLTSEGVNLRATDWPSDTLIVGEMNTGTGFVLWMHDLSAPAGSTLEEYLPPAIGQGRMVVSPDGTLAAYVSAESGVQEVYIRSFPEPGERTIVSSGGGSTWAWAPDGRTLYYVDDTRSTVLAARLQIDPVPVVLRTDTLFSIGRVASERMPGGVLNPKGDRFIVAERVESGNANSQPAAADRLILVHHFFTELCERVGGC